MLRLRRYRVFLIVAILCLGTLWHLTQVQTLDSTSTVTVEGLKNLGLKEKTSASQFILPTSTSPLIVAAEVETSSAIQPTSTISPALPVLPVDAASTSLHTSTSTSSLTSSSVRPAQETVSEPAVPITDEIDESFQQQGQGRLEVSPPKKTDLPKVFWKKQEEHFPVPPGSLIRLPTGVPKKIPKIQYDFSDESSTSRIDRERKQSVIKNAFLRAWEGYKTYAWGKDEIKPISGDFRNPFGGWGATLVDTLDTLWILGLKEEFEEAVNAVKDIDFHTSIRKDIPLFETVIRYLGGLIAAYDMSNGRYRILLDKALELAEVLMGAFDTPNRMPVTYYYWAPSYASQPHRAGTRVVLAELGSLSVEFTRLAQITKDDKYYDAVARITNELEKWQDHTTLPGLWPTHLDASGCRKPERALPQKAHAIAEDSEDLFVKASSPQTPPKDASGFSSTAIKAEVERPKEKEGSTSVKKRDTADTEIASDEEPAVPAAEAKAKFEASANKVASESSAGIVKTPSKSSIVKDVDADAWDADCEEQGLASVPYSQSDTYSIAAMADSTYEYFPKEYMLLGGLNDQYRTMYEKSMETIRKHILYRPMTKDERDVLFPAEQTIFPQAEKEDEKVRTNYEGTHLGCFAGGMLAIGSKIFDLKADMDLASKLTDGCVWSYESTPTGIMPEKFQLTGCKDADDCPWNQTQWWRDLDPYEVYRVESAKRFNEQQQLLADHQREEDKEKKAALKASLATSSATNQVARSEASEKPAADSISKRQVGRGRIAYESDETVKEGQAIKADSGSSQPQPTKTKVEKVSYDAEDTTDERDEEGLEPLFTPKPIASHEDFVQARIKEERLPTSYTKIQDYSYILRPEAIESVWIMYRVTGDEKWRVKGWRMFQAVQTYTQTDHGNSAISDVTSEVPFHKDQMESFWVAETLKYYYLLFSDPTVVSLDDYVLNTEAHPFKRPK